MAGYNAATPHLKNGYKAADWKGIYGRSKFIEFGFSTGKVSASDSLMRGTNWFVGVNVPLMGMKFGNRRYGVKGFLFVPYLAGSVGATSVGGKGAFGGTITAGASLQLPFIVVDFRMNTIVTPGNKAPGMKTVTFMPAMVIGFDALWDVLDPKLQFDGTRWHQYNSYERHVDVEHHEDYDIITTTETTEYHQWSNDVYQYDVGGYIGIGPRVSWTKHAYAGETKMLGLVQSGRARGLMYDLIAETGKVGFASSFADTSTFEDPYPKRRKLDKSDSKYAGSVNCTRGLVRLGFDLNKSEQHANQFTRFMVGLGMGYAFFGTPKYDRESAPEELDAFFASHPNVVANDRMDARKFKDGMFFQLFFSFELGVISIGYERNFYKTAALADVGTLTFTYNLPVDRVRDTYGKLSFIKRSENPDSKYKTQ